VYVELVGGAQRSHVGHIPSDPEPEVVEVRHEGDPSDEVLVGRVSGGLEAAADGEKERLILMWSGSSLIFGLVRRRRN